MKKGEMQNSILHYATIICIYKKKLWDFPSRKSINMEWINGWIKYNECLKHALGLLKLCGIHKYSSGIAKMNVPKW